MGFENICLGHLKLINFPFVPNGKFIIFRCPQIRAHYSLIIICLNIGTPNNHHFPFGTNEKVMVLGSQYLSILGYIRQIYIFALILERLTHIL